MKTCLHCGRGNINLTGDLCNSCIMLEEYDRKEKKKEKEESKLKKVKSLLKILQEYIVFLEERQLGSDILTEIQKIPFYLRSAIIDYGRRETLKQINYELREILEEEV